MRSVAGATTDGGGEFKGMNKFQKAIAKANLNRCLLQFNMEAEFTIIKRSLTMAARAQTSGTHEWLHTSPTWWQRWNLMWTV